MPPDRPAVPTPFGPGLEALRFALVLVLAPLAMMPFEARSTRFAIAAIVSATAVLVASLRVRRLFRGRSSLRHRKLFAVATVTALGAVVGMIAAAIGLARA